MIVVALTAGTLLGVGISAACVHLVLSAVPRRQR